MSAPKSPKKKSKAENPEDIGKVKVHVDTDGTGEQKPNGEPLSDDDLDKVAGGRPKMKPE